MTAIPTYFQKELPMSLAPRKQDTSSSECRPPPRPKPLLRVEFRDLAHPSSHTFLKAIDPSKVVADAVEKVLDLLYPLEATPTGTNTPPKQHLHPLHVSPPASPTQSPLPFRPFPRPEHSNNGGDSTSETSHDASYPAPSHYHIPGTRSVTLILRSMGGVAYTTGRDIDSDHKEIHLSLDYIKTISSRPNATPRALTHEITGVLTHELVHCFQWNAHGSCPGGLIEGIADWVRLRADLVPPHWKREADGDWDAGYQHTGYFLDYLSKRFGEGTVPRVNQALREGEYHQDKFWNRLFGSDVKKLWEEYGEKLKEEEGSSSDERKEEMPKAEA